MKEFGPGLEILESGSLLALEQETVWPEEYLFENSRPHIYCKAVHLAASTIVSWVLAFSSDLPRAPNDVFEAGKGPDGTGSQERLVAAISALILLVNYKRQY